MMRCLPVVRGHCHLLPCYHSNIGFGPELGREVKCLMLVKPTPHERPNCDVIVVFVAVVQGSVTFQIKSTSMYFWFNRVVSVCNTCFCLLVFSVVSRPLGHRRHNVYLIICCSVSPMCCGGERMWTIPWINNIC